MIRKSAVSHPIVFGVLTIIIFQLVMEIVAVALALFAPRILVSDEYVFQATVEAFCALAAIGLVSLFGYNHIWTEKKKGLFAGFGVGGYFIFVQLMAIFLCVDELSTRLEQTGKLTLQPAWKIAVYLVCFLLVGFTEEVFFRGLVANFFFDKHAKNPAGVWAATIWSGLLFGLIHLMNVAGAGIVGAFTQTVVTVAMGMAFTAVYYRTRNIWVVILLHAFNNIWAGFSSGFFEGASLSETIGSYSPIQCIGAIPYILATLFLLRPKKLREIIPSDNDSDITIEQRIAQYSQSKKSKAIAIVVSSIICAVLFTVSVVASVGTNLVSLFNTSDAPLDYSVSETWSGEDYFSDTAEIRIKETDEYDLTIRSYPGDSKAYMTLTITDREGNEVFRETYGGRCSAEESIFLEAGKTYTATMEYDFSEVLDGSTVSYTTIVEIED